MVGVLIWLMSSRPESVEPVASLADSDVLLPEHTAEVHLGDLDSMLERKVIRALVTPSLTDFFTIDGQLLGIQTELLKHFEEDLNQDLGRDDLKTHIVYVPVPFSDLIPALQAGRGDIAAAILTRTPKRQEQVEFVGGVNFEIDEIVVHGANVAGLESIEDLAGRDVYVLRGSSYAEHLAELNGRFKAQALKPIRIVEADPHLTSEDILELVNAGLVEITVVDDYKAKLWAEVLPDIRVRDELVVAGERTAGWAVRRDNPQLQEAIETAAADVSRGTLLGNIFIDRYFKDTRWIDNPLARSDRERFAETAELFRRFGDRYDFDWLALVAQAYQESGLDHSVKSSAGAVGIMQLLPSTAADPNVAIADIQKLENNIEAGAKYMAFLKQRYFSDASISREDQLAFTWAAYNAGPRKVADMRRHAEEMGLDPNRWFQNVEYAALDLVGREPVRYVSNIYKYYVAYRLSHNLALARDASRQML